MNSAAIAERLPPAVVIACAAGMICGTVFGAPADGDVYWQRWLGDAILHDRAIPSALGNETFSAPGAAWTAHEWLFSAFFAAASAARIAALMQLLVCACAAAALWLVADTALRRGAAPSAALAATALTVFGVLPAAGMRVQVVSWLFLAALFAVVFDARRRWMCLPIALLWANVHASALLVPATVGAVLLGTFVERRTVDRDVRALAAIWIGAAAAMFATPLGWRMPAYAVSLTLNPIKSDIVEWRSPLAAHDVAALLLIGVVACAAFVLPRARKLDLAEWLVVATFALLALSAARNVPLFLIAACPIAASAVGRRSYAPERGAGRLRVLALAMSVPLCFAVGLAVARAAERSRTALPYAAAATIAADARDVRVFCSDYSWCGMLVGRPGVRVFLDGRADPYPAAVWDENRRIALTPEAQRLLDRNAVTAVLVRDGDALDRRLRTAPRWRRTFDDNRYAVYRRTPSRAQSPFALALKSAPHSIPATMRKTARNSSP